MTKSGHAMIILTNKDIYSAEFRKENMKTMWTALLQQISTNYGNSYDKSHRAAASLLTLQVAALINVKTGSWNVSLPCM